MSGVRFRLDGIKLHKTDMPARDLASFIEIEMQIGLGHGKLSLMQSADFTSKSQFQLESTLQIVVNSII